MAVEKTDGRRVAGRQPLGSLDQSMPAHLSDIARTHPNHNGDSEPVDGVDRVFDQLHSVGGQAHPVTGSGYCRMQFRRPARR
ncbi:hypothetical protein [Nocardia terpenica]|uniref:hypothetical protein n=1 Tax=Nocardia terpenica TaxID=455432 RepID=UPI001E4EA478|nr:hypothetical protein [Nocardia terpenica]